jgi:predicted RNA-binding Zn-ribbon protein involved in translation (DUF1610 family)
MKCPNCGYQEREFDKELKCLVDGDFGEFFRIAANMNRCGEYIQSASIYGCPKCSFVFIIKD